AAEAPDKGGCRCRLFARYLNPLNRPRVAGYRCLKLHTITAPLHLRLLEKNAVTQTPVGNVPVEFRHRNFEGDTKLRFNSDRDGYVEVKRDQREETFERLAFVTVIVDPRSPPRIPAARIPIAVVDTALVNLHVTPKPANTDSLLALDKQLWEQQ